MNTYSDTVNEIRKFNRFYTVNMGFLSAEYLDSEYSVAETRILFEIKTQKICLQSDIAKELHIDKSYLSRIIKRFEKNGLVYKRKSEKDKRAAYLTLTEKGLDETEKLIQLTNYKIKEQIKNLEPDECRKLCSALDTIMTILSKGD